MKRIYSHLVKFSLCFLIGCTAIPTATEKNPTLLVGKIVLARGDYFGGSKIPINETFTSNINITLRNITSNNLTRFSSNKNGLFYVNLQEGEYIIDDLYTERTNSYGSLSSSIYATPSIVLLKIERGKVNNVGTLNFTFPNIKNEIIQTDNSLAVKTDFLKRFPKSNWNEKEWTYRQLAAETDIINRRNDIRALRDTTYFVKSKNGLDSVSLTIPKTHSAEQRRNAEEHIRSRLLEKK